MAKDLTNKTLATLLVVAIAVSVLGTFLAINKPVYLTGMHTNGTAQVNLTIEDYVAILVTGNINFGTGHVAQNVTHAVIDSCGTDTNVGSGWTTDSNISIENQGNHDLNVSVYADKNATTFFGGTTVTPVQKIKYVNAEAGSCTSGMNAYTAYSTVEQDFCLDFQYEPANDEADVCVELTIPNDAVAGSYTQTLTFKAELS